MYAQNQSCSPANSLNPEAYGQAVNMSTVDEMHAVTDEISMPAIRPKSTVRREEEGVSEVSEGWSSMGRCSDRQLGHAHTINTQSHVTLAPYFLRCH